MPPVWDSRSRTRTSPETCGANAAAALALAAVALAAGLHASRIDGSPLIYNCADPLLPDLLICRPELADQVLAAVAAIR